MSKKFLDLSLVPKVHGVYSGMRYILHRSFVGICSVVFMFWSHTNQPTNGQIDWQSWKHSHLLGRGKKQKCFWLKTNKTKLRVKGYFQIVFSVMNMFLFHTESDTFSWNRTFNCESTEKIIKDQKSTDQSCQTCLTVFIQQAALTQVSQRPTLERDLI